MTPVTPELVEQVRVLRGAGLSLRQIAGRLGIGYGTAHKLAPPPAVKSAPVQPLPEPRGCQYPLNSGRPWVFCGAAVDAPGAPWCAAHRRICYAGRGSWASAA